MELNMELLDFNSEQSKQDSYILISFKSKAQY